MKNNNGKVIRDLSRGSMRKNKLRNFFAILAIILTTILFTVTFTLAAGVLKSIESDTMRQVGTTAHAGFKDLTKDQYDTLCADRQVKAASYNIFFANATNQELQKRSVELRYTEAKDFDWTQNILMEGHLPQKDQEVVLDTLTLKALGVPAKIGQKVTLSWEILGEAYSGTFTLSGYYKGDPLALASEAYFAKTYVDQLLSGHTEQEWKNMNDDTNGVGLIQMDAMYQNSYHIEERTKEIIKECGYGKNEIDYGINWGYMSTGLSSVDPATTVLVIAVLLIILISGYLMIYNIFYISIVEDIRFYGLLKTIGTTGQQVKRLIYRQANILSLVGIPFGLLAGWFLGNALLPLILMQLTGDIATKISFNPLLFLFSIAFTLLTVGISCFKPGKIAAAIAPVEAVKFERIDEKGRKRRKTKRIKKQKTTAKERLSGKFSYFQMARRNLKRDRKKSLLVIASMSLSILLFVLIAVLGGSFSVEKYAAKTLGDTDIYLSTASMQVNGYYTAEDVDITDRLSNLTSYLDSLDLKKDAAVSPLLLDDETIGVAGDAADRYKKAYAQGLIHAHDENDTFTQDQIEATLNGEAGINLSLYGFDYDVLSKLDVIDGTLDQEKYESGNYIVLTGDKEASDTDKTLDLGDTLYQVGDKLEIEGKTYTVMAFVEMPYSLSKKSYSYNGMFAVLPNTEVETIASARGNAYCNVYGATIDVNSSKEETVEKAIDQYTENVDTSLVYQSKNSIVKEYDNLKKMIVLIGGALAVIIGLIALMNYINTIITGIIARKKEFAMMESIGMEKRQLLKVLYAESGSYVVLAWLIASICGILLSQTVIQSFCTNMTWLSYQFPVWAIIVPLPVLLLFSFIVPYFTYRSFKKESAVEALREE